MKPAFRNMQKKLPWFTTAVFAAIAVMFLCARPARAEIVARQCDPRKDKTLYVIGYAHLDTQWRWTYQDSINTFIPNTMRYNFKLFEKYPYYHFNFTGARRYMMMKEYYPADYAKVKDYIAQDRWYLSGSSVDENDANVPSGESMIRQVLYGNQYFRREFGKTSIDYMLPDCFGFTASLPSLLAHAGLKGFSTQKLGWGSPIGIPFNVGIWEGPDGKYIAAALNPGSYVHQIRSDLSNDAGWLKRINELGEKSGFYADFHYYGVGDVGGAPDDESVAWLGKSIDGGGPICIAPSSSDKIFREITAEEVPKMPRYKGDLLLTEHSAGSLTSQAYIKRWNRKNELLADNAERASAASAWMGAAKYPAKKLYDAWLLLLGGQMHDILPGTALPKAYEFSWNDDVIVMNQMAGTVEDAVGAVARQLDTRSGGVSLVVYNPLSIAREDVAQADVAFPGGAPRFVQVIGPDGKEVPSQILKPGKTSATIAFIAKVPPVGFAVYEIKKAAAASKIKSALSVTANSLENERFKVRIDANGDVASVWDKSAKREVLAAPIRLDFMEDSPRDWPAWNIDWEDWKMPPRAYVGAPANVKIIESGPVRVTLEITRQAEGSRFVQNVRLATGSAGDRLEFDTSIDWRTQGTCVKASFPLSVANNKASYNLQLGVIDRPNNDMGKYEVPAHQWLDLTDASGDYGAAVLEDSKFGSDKPSDNTVRLTLLRTPRCRDYCDQATQDLGRHRILYALAPHKGDWRTEGTHWKAARLNQPLLSFATPKHAGNLGKSFSFLSANSNQVDVKAIKKAEESDEILIRIQELFGKPANGVEISFAAQAVSAREVNGQEEPVGAATIIGGKLKADFTPFALRSFIVKLAAPKTVASAPVSSPVSLVYDTVAATDDGEASEKGFDGKGFSYPAEMLPAKLNVDGIDFNLGAAGAGRKNAIASKGQNILLPKGNFNRVYILASATGGDVSGTFAIDGKATPLKVQEWKGYVGQWDNRIWKTGRDISGLQPAFTKRDRIAWFASHHHNPSGIHEAYLYSYLFKYRIDLPKNAKKLTLPDNPRIRVFAVTAAHNENDETSPAQLLYDNFDKPIDAPRFDPAEGKYSDVVKVSAIKPWFTGEAEIRYTTDGSEPTVNSPLFTESTWVYGKTTFRARAFSGGKAYGPGVSATYDVNDTTAPRVDNVAALSIAPAMFVRFTERPDKTSAENAANYSIGDVPAVTGARLLPDGVTVEVSLSESVKKGRKYTLAIGGIRDMSPNGNTLTATKIEFRSAVPALSIRFPTPDLTGSMGVDGWSPFDFKVNGNPKIVRGKIGNALRLSGESQCLTLNDRPELDITNQITITAWVKSDDWSGNRRIIQKGNEDNQYSLRKEGNNIMFHLAGVGSVTVPGPSVKQWHHIAGTYDGRTISLYIDGALAGAAPATGEIAVTGDSLYIGTKSTTTAAMDDYFKGDLDEIMIWDYALSGEHIKMLANPATAATIK